MKLFELTGIKHLKDKSPKELIQYITGENNAGRTKLTILGAGSNGVALTDGSNVFKFWHRDSSYENFIQYAMKNQNNPHVPKIKSKIKTLPFNIESSNDGDTIKGIRYIKMEKLNPLPDSNVKINILSDKGCDELGVTTKTTEMRFDDVMLHCLFAPSVEVACQGLAQGILKQKNKDHNTDKLEKPYSAGFLELFDRNFIGLINTLRDFILSSISEEDFPDLHSGNFLLRNTGQLVIVDPIANMTDITLNADLMAWTQELN